MTRVYMLPIFRGPDKGDGGIRRVVEAQERWLPKYGIQIVSEQADADVIALHAGTWPSAKIAPQTPIVAHCHGLYWEGYSWAKWALALNQDVIQTIRRADVVTAPSEWVAQAIRRGTWADAIPLYHGIEPEDWPEPSEPREDYVLWNKTRVDPICDPAPLDELARLAKDVRFITTFGKERANVSITGPQPYDDAKRYVRYAGVYLATARETFGIGTIEAMAAGVPVLGWRWGGQAEIVRHMVDGYLAEPGNYEDLHEGLLWCLENRATLGKAARERVLADFTNEFRMEPYANLYHELHDKAKTSKRVSVIMPYYNLGRYVKEAVTSVVSQLGANDELIIVDDHSPEPLPGLDLPETLPCAIRYIVNDKNLYLAETLNAGITEAEGRYILNLDADNILAPNAIKTLAGALDDSRDLDIAYGKMEVFNDNNSTERFVSGWPPEEAHPGLQIMHQNQVPSTAMYRRRVWERVGGYRRRCHTAEDADFWSRALTVGFRGRRVTDAVTLVYRDRGDSMSRSQGDWDWHRWYSYALDPKLRLFAAGGENIPTHEFPLVSVVIPVGPGHERYVLDALDSLKNQTFRFWEAVVINDSGQHLQGLPAWARVTASRIDGMGKLGAASARNIGLDLARAKYVVFLDADDWLQPKALELMFETIKLTGGFVYSDWFHAETGERKNSPPFDPDRVLRGLGYPVTCMYDREELAEKGIRFDTSFNHKGWEDWDFQIQVVAEHGICGNKIAAPLLHYRYKTGTLRESAYSSQKEMEQEILNKWGDYIDGKKENMARCGGCGGLRPPEMLRTDGTMPARTQANGDEGEVVEVEYLAQNPGKVTFIGRGSGTRYKFDIDEQHKVRKVFKNDVDGLLAQGIFRVKPATPQPSQEDFTPMRAEGPPVPA
jgi:glycosyltransferase involved in cell wall biosynthesis